MSNLRSCRVGWRTISRGFSLPNPFVCNSLSPRLGKIPSGTTHLPNTPVQAEMRQSSCAFRNSNGDSHGKDLTCRQSRSSSATAFGGFWPKIREFASSDEACNFSEAITKAHQISPDVLILDLHMPLGPGLSISDLRAQLNSCGARVLGMSFANDDDARSLATSMGAAELVDKMQLGKELIPSIMRVASANNCFSPALSVKPSDRSAA